MKSMIDDQAHSDPAHLLAGLAADGLYFRGESYCGCFLTDGKIPRAFVTAHDPDGTAADRLVAAGLWTPTDEGWISVGYLDRNPSREKVLELRARRSSAGKRGADRRWNTRNSNGHGNGHSPSHAPTEPPAVDTGNPTMDALLTEVSTILREPQKAGREVLFDPDDVGVKMVVLRYEQRPRDQHVAAAREAARMLSDPGFGQRTASRVLQIAWDNLDKNALKTKAAGVRKAAESGREDRAARRAARRSDLAGSSLLSPTEPTPVDAVHEEIR